MHTKLVGRLISACEDNENHKEQVRDLLKNQEEREEFFKGLELRDKRVLSAVLKERRR